MAYQDWSKPKAGENLVPSQYGVKIIPAQPDPTKSYVYRAGVRKLTGPENSSNHNIYIDVLDENGNRIQWARINWNWQGNSGTPPNPAIVDKPANEPGTNISVTGGMKVWIKLEGTFPADRLEYFSIDFPDDDPPGSTWGHHSYLVIYRKVSVNEPDPEPEPEPEQPKAAFSFAPIAPLTGQQIKFTNQSQNADSYVWDFGNEQATTFPSPTFIYQEPGTYQVTLTAKKGTASNQVTKPITVTLDETEPPVPEPVIIGHREMVIYAEADEDISRVRLLGDEVYDEMPDKKSDVVGYEAWFVQLADARRLIAKAESLGRSYIMITCPVERIPGFWEDTSDD